MINHDFIEYLNLGAISLALVMSLFASYKFHKFHKNLKRVNELIGQTTIIVPKDANGITTINLTGEGGCGGTYQKKTKDEIKGIINDKS